MAHLKKYLTVALMATIAFVAYADFITTHNGTRIYADSRKTDIIETATEGNSYEIDGVLDDNTLRINFGEGYAYVGHNEVDVTAEDDEQMIYADENEELDPSFSNNTSYYLMLIAAIAIAVVMSVSVLKLRRLSRSSMFAWIMAIIGMIELAVFGHAEDLDMMPDVSTGAQWLLASLALGILLMQVAYTSLRTNTGYGVIGNGILYLLGFGFARTIAQGSILQFGNIIGLIIFLGAGFFMYIRKKDRNIIQGIISFIPAGCVIVGGASMIPGVIFPVYRYIFAVIAIIALVLMLLYMSPEIVDEMIEDRNNRKPRDPNEYKICGYCKHLDRSNLTCTLFGGQRSTGDTCQHHDPT